MLSLRKAGGQSEGALKVKKRKPKLKWIILAVVIVAAALVLLLRPKAETEASISYGETTVLKTGEFSNTISATGMVESDSVHKVYSTQGYNVEEVYVEVGDVVDEDTLLCRLDSSYLEDQIKTRELSSGVSARAAAQAFKTAQDSYNSAKAALDNGENSTILNAENAVRTAKENYDRAVTSYNNYKDALDAGLNQSVISSDASVKNAEKSLDSARSSDYAAQDQIDAAEQSMKNYRDGIQSLQTAVGSAQREVNSAQSALEQAESDSAALPQLETAAETAKSDLDRAQAELEAASEKTPELEKAVDEARAAYEQVDSALKAAQESAGNISALREALSEAEDNLKSAQEALVSASAQSAQQYSALESAINQAERAQDSTQLQVEAGKIGYDNAVKSREATLKSVDDTLKDYATAVDTAKAAYDAALQGYDAAVSGAESGLLSSYNSMLSAQLNTDNSVAALELAMLQEDLEDTNIYSGASGTVTAVYAEEGSSGTGLLFVIEDVGDLVIETSVKEYDVNTISVGMPVSIQSEATGDDEYEGEIISIAPTVGKNALGDTDTMGEGEFSVKVRVTSPNTRLRIGTSVRLKYIVERHSAVLAVPYDAVFTDENGKTCVIVADEDGKGGCTLRKLEVTTGAENDLDIIISGEGVCDGLRIVNEAGSYRDYIGRSLALTERSFAAQFPFMQD